MTDNNLYDIFEPTFVRKAILALMLLLFFTDGNS